MQGERQLGLEEKEMPRSRDPLTCGEEVENGLRRLKAVGVGVSTILRWCLVALTTTRSCGREKWTSTFRGSRPGNWGLDQKESHGGPGCNLSTLGVGRVAVISL
jgi:hypothetical protein